MFPNCSMNDICLMESQIEDFYHNCARRRRKRRKRGIIKTAASSRWALPIRFAVDPIYTGEGSIRGGGGGDTD